MSPARSYAAVLGDHRAREPPCSSVTMISGRHVPRRVLTAGCSLPTVPRNAVLAHRGVRAPRRA
jgi:hypothetical protein